MEESYPKNLPDVVTRGVVLPPLKFNNDRHTLEEIQKADHFLSIKNFNNNQNDTSTEASNITAKKSFLAAKLQDSSLADHPLLSNEHNIRNQDATLSSSSYSNAEIINTLSDETASNSNEKFIFTHTTNNYPIEIVAVSKHRKENNKSQPHDEVYDAESNGSNSETFFRNDFESKSPPPSLLEYYALSKVETNESKNYSKPDYRKLAIELATQKKTKLKKRLKKYCDYVLVFPVEDQDFISVSERSLFEGALRKDGLDLTYTILGDLMFVEIYTSFERLCKQAELVCLEMPLQGLELHESSNDVGLFKSIQSRLRTDTEADMLSAPFCCSSKNIFYGVNNKKTFFRSAYRSMLVHHILETTKISLNRNHSESPVFKTGLSALLHSKAYIDAFILNDRSEYDSKFALPKKKELTFVPESLEELSDSRKDLNDTWLKWTKNQPLWKIRNYYGEKIAFYFAWLGVLVTSLWIPVLLGLAIFIFGFTSAVLDDHNSDSKPNITLTSFEKWISKAMDNDATPFFAFVICIWGTVFLEFWKRKNNTLAHKWDVDNFEEQEQDRPQFYGTKVLKDPLTGLYEPFYPVWRKVLKSMGSIGIILFMIGMVVVSVVSVAVYKVVSRVDWFKSLPQGSLASSITSSVLNTLSILILGRVYKKLACRLTDWENHQTRTKYDDALVLKLFGFQFVNSYASLFYIAFFRERTSDTGLFALGKDYSDSCGVNNDCMSLLSLQVAVLMIMKPLPKFTSDIIIPFLSKLVRRFCCCFGSNKVEASDMNLPNDSDALYEQYLVYELKKPPLGDFTLSEYTEKVLQYGYLMLFAAAFPLAPLIALITNIIDMQIDGRRLLWFNRRPVPQRAEDIGMWFTILSFLNFVGIFTNAFIIGFTSRYGRKYQTTVIQHTLNTTVHGFYGNVTDVADTNVLFIEANTYQHLWIIIIFENVALTIKFIVAYVIPDVPASVERAKRQEKIQLEKLLSKSGLTAGPGRSIRHQSPSKLKTKSNNLLLNDKKKGPEKKRSKKKKKFTGKFDTSTINKDKGEASRPEDQSLA